MNSVVELSKDDVYKHGVIEKLGVSNSKPITIIDMQKGAAIAYGSLKKAYLDNPEFKMGTQLFTNYRDVATAIKDRYIILSKVGDDITKLYQYFPLTNNQIVMYKTRYNIK